MRSNEERFELLEKRGDLARHFGFLAGINAAADWIMDEAGAAFQLGWDKEATALRKLSGQLREALKDGTIEAPEKPSGPFPEANEVLGL